MNLWTCNLSYAEKDGPSGAIVTTACANLHKGDLVAYNTKTNSSAPWPTCGRSRRSSPTASPTASSSSTRTGVELGDDIKPVINADDHVVEFEITPNRPDCLSVIGLARRCPHTYDTPLRLHEAGGEGGRRGRPHRPSGRGDPRRRPGAPVHRPDGAQREDRPLPQVDAGAAALHGVRPINNIVDITNYVMLEYRPAHARLRPTAMCKGGKIIVRRAQEGEELTTLDGNVRKLTANHLVIADEHRAVGLAGIMGGENSEIVADTTDVVFESACFDGTCIRKGALALGMRTEASAKFEKGLDP